MSKINYENKTQMPMGRGHTAHLIVWFIDWIVFYTVPAIFQPYNGGRLRTMSDPLNNKQDRATCIKILSLKYKKKLQKFQFVIILSPL